MSVPAEVINSTPTLGQLLQGIAVAAAVDVPGIASDSRLVQDGFLFLAVQGIGSHGMDYLEHALANGAASVVYDASTAAAPENCGVPVVAIENLAGQLGEIANRYYGNPSATMKVVGVTGTNGKTTVAWMIAHCLQQLGRRCGYVGTLGSGVDELNVSTGMTTPDVVELHERLADLVDADASYAAIEVSSHALQQQRIAGVNFSAALFTNLSRDHLDYHGDMQSYFDAKAKLFTTANPDCKIVNLDSRFGLQLADRLGQDVIVVSTERDRVANGQQHVFVRAIEPTARGSQVAFVSSWGDGRFHLPLVGDFNVANGMMVLAYLLSEGVEQQHAVDALGDVVAPPGRMQHVANSNVFIDYAHTPDALESALRALRPHCRGRLWCVFGCGGDRDTGKRAQMGQLAERHADVAIVTSDNPRSEAPGTIIDDIVSGFDVAPTIVEDRAAAIAWAINASCADDIVLLAGKGHEDYQEIGGKRLPFSDYVIAVAALRGGSQ